MLIDAFREAAGLELTDEDGNTEALRLLPPATVEELAELEANLPAPLPEEIRAALGFAKGFENPPIESLSLIDLDGFGLEQVFPHAHSIGHDGFGLTGTAGAGLKETSAISKELEGVWVERDGKMFPSCDEPSLDKFRALAKSSPRFPWAHYALAVCLRTRGDAEWRRHAGQAVEIFETTTLLAEHHGTHDQGFQELRGYLNAP